MMLLMNPFVGIHQGIEFSVIMGLYISSTFTESDLQVLCSRRTNKRTNTNRRFPRFQMAIFTNFNFVSRMRRRLLLGLLLLHTVHLCLASPAVFDPSNSLHRRQTKNLTNECNKFIDSSRSLFPTSFFFSTNETTSPVLKQQSDPPKNTTQPINTACISTLPDPRYNTTTLHWTLTSTTNTSSPAATRSDVAAAIADMYTQNKDIFSSLFYLGWNDKGDCKRISPHLAARYKSAAFKICPPPAEKRSKNYPTDANIPEIDFAFLFGVWHALFEALAKKGGDKVAGTASLWVTSGDLVKELEGEEREMGVWIADFFIYGAPPASTKISGFKPLGSRKAVKAVQKAEQTGSCMG